MKIKKTLNTQNAKKYIMILFFFSDLIYCYDVPSFTIGKELSDNHAGYTLIINCCINNVLFMKRIIIF